MSAYQYTHFLLWIQDRFSATSFESTVMAQVSAEKTTGKSTPFTVHVSDDDLQQLDLLLRITPIAKPTYETSLPGGDRKYGMRRDWLKQAVEEWKSTFDW